MHTFQGNCGSTCNGSGDFLCDTPPTSNGGFGCGVNSTCSNDQNGPSPYTANMNDQFENYMSYSTCQYMFTVDQATVMVSFLTSPSTSEGLQQLSNPTNWTATGIADPYNPPTCEPIAEFTYDKEYICEGASVTFTDASYNGVATGWNWVFAGGSPTTSTAQNPTVTYNNAGVYGVIFTPSNAQGNDTENKSSIITVSSLTADYTGPFVDGFENTTAFNNEWIIQDPTGGQAWEINSNAATGGTQSVRVRNFFTNDDGAIDALISPSYDINSLTSKTMSFQQAFAKTNGSDADALRLYTSIDCGNTWTLRAFWISAQLTTAPDHGSLFIPTSSEWSLRTQSLTSVATATNVRFKFEFTAGGGNDIYLDDINIGGVSSVFDFDSKISNYNIYPNPTNSNAKITFSLVEQVNNLSIIIRNALGQEVTSVINGQSFIPGEYTLNIDEQRQLPAGLYFVEFNVDGASRTLKLMIQ